MEYNGKRASPNIRGRDFSHVTIKGERGECLRGEGVNGGGKE